MLHRPTSQPSVKSPASQTLNHNLRACTLDAAFYGSMVGFGETYLAAFAVAIGLGQVTAGLATSLPILCGGIAQLFSFGMLRSKGSYRKWITICVCVQGFSFIPLLIAAIVGTIPAWMFYAIASLYWAGGMASSPAWNAWVSQIVPPKIRSRYFASRTRYTQAATFASFLAGGLILNYFSTTTHAVQGYIVLFGAAVVARFVSLAYLIAHRTTPEIDTANIDAVSWTTAWKSLDVDSRRVIFYLVAMTGALQLAGPFFGPFMLVQLKFDYTRFVAVIAIAFVTRIISLKYWGKYAAKFGVRRLLWTAGFALIPLAPLWCISHNFFWILSLQCIAGIVYAAYELATMLVFFESVPLARRAQILTMYNFGNSLFFFCGAAVGGWMLSSAGATVAGYHTLFVTSGLLRLICVGSVFLSVQSQKRTSQRALGRIDRATSLGGLRTTPTAPIDIRGPAVITGSLETIKEAA